MTVPIAVPTEPTELLATAVPAMTAGRGPAGGFDLLMALLQAQLSPMPATPVQAIPGAPATAAGGVAPAADGAVPASTTPTPTAATPVAAVRLIKGSSATPASNVEAAVEPSVTPILAAAGEAQRRAPRALSPEDAVVAGEALPLLEPLEDEAPESSTAQPWLDAALAVAVLAPPVTTPPVTTPTPVEGELTLTRGEVGEPGEIRRELVPMTTSSIVAPVTARAGEVVETAAGMPVPQMEAGLETAARPQLVESSAPAASPTFAATDASAQAEVAETAVVAASDVEARPRPLGLRALAGGRGRDGLHRVDGSVAQEAGGADAAPALRLVPGRRGLDVGATRDLLEGIHGRGARDASEGRGTADPDAVIGGVSAPSTSATSPTSSDVVDAPAPAVPRDPVEQIATRLRDVKGPGRHEISVRLDPPDLGAVRIDARLEGARLHLSIRAEHAPTGEMLADALPRLRESLVQQGFIPADVSVHLGMDGSGRQFTRDGAPTFTPAPDGERVPQAPVVRASARAVATTDGIDVWA